jgi:hypothetical protein
MIDCLEFRRRVGAEPFAADPEVAAHRRDCAACARHQDELQAMDGLIRRALEVDPMAAKSGAATPAPVRAPRRRIFAIAAGLAAGIAVALFVFVGGPRAAIAREVVEHIQHEPGSMDHTTPVAAAELDDVLGPAGLSLKPGAGDVTYAMRCPFDGQVVPHLVVRTPDGPVTVLVLAHREVGKPVRFDLEGYSGVVLPAPRGSIAVVGRRVTDLDAVAARVFDAVDWNS